jgi:hypothetical protein
MALVPESVSKSIITSSERREKRLKPASASRPSRSARVVSRSGSTLFTLKGSMMVLKPSMLPPLRPVSAAG